jgi:hypothetical protein
MKVTPLEKRPSFFLFSKKKKDPIGSKSLKVQDLFQSLA